MPLKSEIIDGSFGTEQKAGVNDRGQLCISSGFATLPDVGTASQYRYVSSLAGSDGADSGTTNMNVDGSVTEQEFYVGASADYDLHIMAVVIIIADQNIAHNLFGGVAVATLINGWDLKTVEANEETFLLKETRTSGQVIAQAGFANPYGSGATSFQLTKWTGTEDAHTIIIPIGEYIPDGIRIGRGTKDKLVSVVKDDLTGLTEFTVRVIGFRHYA